MSYIDSTYLGSSESVCNTESEESVPDDIAIDYINESGTLFTSEDFEKHHNRRTKVDFADAFHEGNIAALRVGDTNKFICVHKDYLREPGLRAMKETVRVVPLGAFSDLRISEDLWSETAPDEETEESRSGRRRDNINEIVRRAWENDWGSTEDSEELVPQPLAVRVPVSSDDSVSSDGSVIYEDDEDDDDDEVQVSNSVAH